MPPEPDDQLEKLLAADEQAISDDGFSQRVVEWAGKDMLRRRAAIYGAGIAGLGFAVGGVVELEPHLTGVTGWIDAMAASVESFDVGGAVQGASNGMLLVIAALAAGVTCLLTAFSLQNR